MERLKVSLVICILLCTVPGHSFSRRKNKVLICKNRAFQTLQPLPALTYQCPADVTNDYDDRILESPERIRARNSLVRELTTFTHPGWWESAVDDLNICYFRGKPGVLSAQENEKFMDPEYQVRLLGNNQSRLVVTPDPCYQTHYNGANVYLLFRNRVKVYVTEVLDGYYSRVADSISLRFLRLYEEQVIEISTVNILGMRPETSRHYFVIDKATKKAIPKKLSRRGKKRGLNDLSR